MREWGRGKGVSTVANLLDTLCFVSYNNHKQINGMLTICDFELWPFVSSRRLS